MKAKEINVQLVVNLGNYESARIGCEYVLEEGENEHEAIRTAYENLKRTANAVVRLKLEPVSTAANLPVLTEDNPRFAKAKQAIAEGKCTIADVERVFQVSDDLKAKLCKG